MEMMKFRKEIIQLLFFKRHILGKYKIKFQLDDVTNIMSKNIQKIYERGEKLDDLEKRAERIEEGAKVFQKSAKKLKQKSFMENNKMKLLMAGGGALLILIIVIIILASLGII